MNQNNNIKHLFTMKKTAIIIAVAFYFMPWARSQTGESKINLDGYVSNTLSYTNIPKNYGFLLNLDPSKSYWISNHYLQNRLNLFVYPLKNMKGSVQLRNRVFYGEYIQDISGYASQLEQDNGWVDLSKNVIDEDKYVLIMAIDRLWLQYTLGKFDFKAGRQRINWSQTFAFNPNDIFNTYSFFEVDYPERPGTDALRISYYPTFSSTAEVALSVDSANRVTAAGLYRFNKWNYDIQVLAGMLSENDYVLGMGWSGSIKGAGFRGEATYFHPKNNVKDTTGVFLTSISFDYMFNNSLYLQLEALYNQIEDEESVKFFQILRLPLTPKSLSFTEYSLLANGSYPITPLWNTSLSFIYYPKMNAVFIGPSVDYSASNNLTLSLIWQTFYGEFPNPLTLKEEKKAFNFAYFRMKFNF
jgi:hypothetical protein